MKQTYLFILAITLLVTPIQVAAAGPYAVVVSRATLNKKEWKPVVDALVSRHKATVVPYDTQVSESLATLQNQFPQHTCFVATPEEVTPQFVAKIHQLTGKLDNDPYTDTRWGILTGYDAANALAIARHQQPLTIRKVASGTEIALECCTEGLWYDELVKNKLVRKKPGGAAQQQRGPDDTTAALADTLNQYRADLFVTSGHATQRNWMIGFRYRNGFFRSKAGQMYGENTQNKRIEISSDNPKVYLPIGNCLMGDINGPDSMALAWMNDVGVKQMIGYMVPTWFGYQGWGVLDYFIEQPGRYTLSEAFFANHHALVHRLSNPGTSATDKRGLAFDRNVVAFYGDPAWPAQMAPGKLAYQQSLTVDQDVYTFTITPNQGDTSFDTVNKNGSQRGGRPFVAFLDHRITKVNILEGQDLQPVITDDFILVPRPATCDPSRPYRVVFRATLQD